MAGGAYGDRPFGDRRTQRVQHGLRRIVPLRSSHRDDPDVTLLQSENSILRDTIRQLEEENQRLKQRAQRMIGLENFEGERFFRDELDAPMWVEDVGGGGKGGAGIAPTGEEITQEEMLWCDQLEEGERLTPL